MSFSRVTIPSELPAGLQTRLQQKVDQQIFDGGAAFQFCWFEELEEDEDDTQLSAYHVLAATDLRWDLTL